MPAPDPMDLVIAKLRGQSDQQIAFYQEHLKGLVAAVKQNLGKYDRDQLIQLTVKALMEGDNSREDLCYQIVVAVDMMARAK